jgi:hypothetical protein
MWSHVRVPSRLLLGRLLGTIASLHDVSGRSVRASTSRCRRCARARVYVDRALVARVFGLAGHVGAVEAVLAALELVCALVNAG